MAGPLRCWLAALLVALLVADGNGPNARGADEGGVFQPRAGDEIWLVSTRRACCVDQTGWSSSRYEAGYWVDAGQKDFRSEVGADTTTVVYIHGNRMDAAGAEARGLAIYRELHARFDGGPVRFVIWSWPSDQIRGPVRDVRAKAVRSDDEAYLLAHFLAGIPAKRRVGLIGFSYGARIVGGALHLLGGGELVGRNVGRGDRADFRVVYWAGAVQNDWLLPDNVHGRAMPLGQKWLNIYSRCDSILWRFDKVDRCDGSPAQGFVGLASKERLPLELAARYEDWDVADRIDSEHRSEPYFYSGDVIRRTRETLLDK